ncbi:MAG: tetratricopeptide repeat protein [Chloroflexi bacterium]|nr:tetratricopeptide repeat protein [Chloroflexota bacterium]
MPYWNQYKYKVAILAFMFALFAIWGYSKVWQAERAIQQGDYHAAAEAYARIARVLFWSSDLWEKAGIAAVMGNDHAAAIAYFEKAPSLSEAGWLRLAGSHYQLGDSDSAIHSIEQGLQTHDSASLYGLLALIYREQKNFQREQAALLEQTRLDTEDAYAHYRLGLLLMLSTPEEALPILTRASFLNPEVDSAVQTARAALALSSTQTGDSQKLLSIGRAFGLVQEWELAVEAFTQAVELDPKNAEAWAWLGEANQQTGQEGGAELDQALSLSSTNPNVFALRALQWSRQGKYELALEEYLLAAKYDAENPAWQAGIGDAYAKLGDLVAALAAYQRAVELSPREASYLVRLAFFCAENGVNLEDVGLPAAQQAVQLAPNDPFALDALGLSYFSLRYYVSAEMALLKAIEAAPEYFPAHIHLALTYLAQGKRTAAFNSLTYVRDADESGVYHEAALQLLSQYFP